MMASSYYQNLIKRVLDRDGMSVYRKVLEKAGVKEDFDEIYQDYDRIYEESGRQQEKEEKK